MTFFTVVWTFVFFSFRRSSRKTGMFSSQCPPVYSSSASFSRQGDSFHQSFTELFITRFCSILSNRRSVPNDSIGASMCICEEATQWSVFVRRLHIWILNLEVLRNIWWNREKFSSTSVQMLVEFVWNRICWKNRVCWLLFSCSLRTTKGKRRKNKINKNCWDFELGAVQWCDNRLDEKKCTKRVLFQ